MKTYAPLLRHGFFNDSGDTISPEINDGIMLVEADEVEGRQVPFT
jgi:hypothetical protein